MTIPKGLYALIDADIIKYRCAFAAEKTHYLVSFLNENGFHEMYGTCDTHKEAKEMAQENGVIWSRKEVQPVEFALQAAKTTIEAILVALEPSGWSLILSGETNFRDTIATTRKYKGNRDRRPAHYEAVEEYLKNVWKATVTDGIEADDAIGIGMSEHPDDGLIVSTDKDLDQIAGWHYNWVDGRAYFVTPKDADFNLFTQVIAGDPTDNVPGVEGVGVVGAKDALAGSTCSKELADRAFSLYRDRYGDKAYDYFLEQGTLVYILRSKDDNFSFRTKGP